MRKAEYESQLTPYERKLQFIEDAVAEGGLVKLPFKTNPQQWERQQDVGITYAFGEDSQEDLGVIFQGNRNRPLTRQAIRNQNSKFIRNLYDNSSFQLKETVTPEVLSAQKPKTQKTREKLSAAAGGISLAIKEQLQQGRSPRQISALLEKPLGKLRQNRKVLQVWGIEFPRTITNYTTLKETVEKETDDQKLQEILEGLSNGQLNGFLNRHTPRRLEDNVFTTISRVALANGLNIKTRRVPQAGIAIRNTGIPIRTVERDNNKAKKGKGISWVVFAKHEQRIVEVFRSNPNLYSQR